MSTHSEFLLSRARLRERWELASVLNFLHVFQPVVKIGFEISAEEIEAALIVPNDALAQLHVALLKGIPPVGKNLTTSDVWVTALCKKLAIWWPWVAEGEVPLVANCGAEISRYKELDPASRLLMLKAICEIRADQDDAYRYIDETIKQGSELSTFRKDKIGTGKNGASYWYDGDSIIGHRLYREINKVAFDQRVKGNTFPKRQMINLQWETLATNLEEFLGISDKLSSSELIGEAKVGETLKNDIIPVLEKLQKKKERAQKWKQAKALRLESFHALQTGTGRSLRRRKPISYTFDEYDRSINDAIKTMKKAKNIDEQNDRGRQNLTDADDINVDYDDMYAAGGGGDDDVIDESDYDGKNDDGDHNEGPFLGISGNDKLGDVMHAKQTKKDKGCRHIEVLGLRHSKRRAASNGFQIPDAPRVDIKAAAVTKKILRQRPTRNMTCDLVVSDSEDGESTETKNVVIINDSNENVKNVDFINDLEENVSSVGESVGTN